jgi:hypothetical protein
VSKGWRGKKTEVPDEEEDEDKTSEIKKNGIRKWESDVEGKINI